jgi:tetratricopeptide (TPR) repeat protein
MEPTYPETYYNRGLARIEMHELNEAIKDFEKALELNSNNPGIYSGLG